jgi:hypothetical protein
MWPARATVGRQPETGVSSLIGTGGALEALQVAAGAAAERLSANCPRDETPPAAERLEALVKSIDAADSAFASIEPALQQFYAALDDEQKANAARGSAGGAVRPRARLRKWPSN